MIRICLKFFLLILLTVPQSHAAEEEKSKEPSGPPTDIEAIMAYPEAVRKAALEVSLHQHLLLEIKNIEHDSHGQLKQLIAGKPRRFQDQVYQMVRFPNLIMEITAGGPKSSKALNSILSPYPREIRGIAKNFSKNQFALLKKIDAINQAANKKFDSLTQDYPAETKKAFLIVLQHPVILNILSKNPKASYVLGKQYSEASPEAKSRLAAVTPAAQKRDAAAAAARKQECHLDPACEKLEETAKDFVAKADEPLEKVQDPKKMVQVNVTYDPYFNSYWNGAPSFYDYPYWYGFPDWGYVYDDWWM